jgi:hypothetical protein
MNKRKPIDKEPEPDLIAEFKKANPNMIYDKHLHPNAKVFVTKKFVDKFDLVLVDKFFYYLEDNWQALKDSNVFWRTFYYSSEQDEFKASILRGQGLKVIRMYENEVSIPGNCKSDYVLPNYVDGEVYKGWTGHELQSLTFQNDFFARYHANLPGTRTPLFEGYHLYTKLIAQHPELNWIFHGYNNRCNFCKGVVDWETQKQLYKDSRVYFSLGSKPGPFTYSFLEAAATGTPTINFGMGLGDCYESPRTRNSYILPNILENGVDGFFSDNPQELVDYVKELYNNEELAKSVSKAGREKVLRLFGKEAARQKWAEFFKNEL